VRGVLPMGEWTAEFQTTLTQSVAAYDLKSAAAIAAAMAKSRGWKLMTVQSTEDYQKAKQERK